MVRFMRSTRPLVQGCLGLGQAMIDIVLSEGVRPDGLSGVEGGLDGRRGRVGIAFRGSNLGNVDMKIADRIGLELALGRGFAFDLR